MVINYIIAIDVKWLFNFISNTLQNNIEYIKQKHCFLKQRKTFTTIRVTKFLAHVINERIFACMCVCVYIYTCRLTAARAFRENATATVQIIIY